jgi:hypothetical protein
MTCQLSGRSLGRLVREWFDVCHHAFQSLSEYDEIDPETLRLLAFWPPIVGIGEALRQILCSRAESVPIHIVRLSPLACALLGRRYPSFVCVDRHCHCLDR